VEIVGYTYKAENYTPLGIKELLIREGRVAREVFEPRRTLGEVGLPPRWPSIYDVIATLVAEAGGDIAVPETYDSGDHPKPIFQDEIEFGEDADFTGRPQVIARFAVTTFKSVADQQGWDDTARLTVLAQFIQHKGMEADLAAFAAQVADVENGS